MESLSRHLAARQRLTQPEAGLFANPFRDGARHDRCVEFNPRHAPPGRAAKRSRHFHGAPSTILISATDDQLTGGK
jgi:hypothetical protein